ncbi:DivIVA domain-containing protein [Nocardioides houyundeii]|uniref:DivIVA domain-containing protein n=1 Tax=Nocardioides houyundeii TaxID=2045452 RepID=UPI000DF1525E|nr:DivIVA domain-containing protein [Nocardioides houyundeii]
MSAPFDDTNPDLQVAAQVNAALFPVTRFRVGYDMQEVDRFLARIGEDLTSGDPRIQAQEVADKRFKPVRMRDGYGVNEVDDLLDQVANHLRVMGRADAAAATRATAEVRHPAGAHPAEWDRPSLLTVDPQTGVTAQMSWPRRALLLVIALGVVFATVYGVTSGLGG